MVFKEDSELENIINRLLEFRNGRPAKNSQLTEQEIRKLCVTSKNIFLKQPNLLELEAPIKICGSRFYFPQKSNSFRRRSWTVQRLVKTLRLRSIASRCQLSFPWGLCRSRKTKLRNHLPSFGLQSKTQQKTSLIGDAVQVSGKLFPAAWEPRMRVHKSYLWIFR